MKRAMTISGTLLLGVAVGISWAWGAPGTVNGATILAIGIAAVGLLALRFALHDMAQSVEQVDEPKATIRYASRDPRPDEAHQLASVQRGDLWFVQDGDGYVAAMWKHDGERWQLEHRYRP